MNDERLQAQQALFEKEEFWQAISDAAPMPLFISRVSDSEIIYANAHVGPVFGVSPQEMVGRKILDYYHDPAERMALLEQIAIHGNLRDYELRMKTADDAPVWIASNNALLTVRGEPALICGFIDITERKRAEQALRESEERFRVIVETAPIPMFILRADDGTILYANSLVGSAVGRPVEHIVGRKTLDFYRRPQERKKILEMLRGEGRIRGYELQVMHADGTPRWISLNSGMLTYQGEPAIVSGYIDITERKFMEQALRESEQRFRALYDHNPSMFFTLDAQGTILSVNQFGAEQLGYRPEELRGKPASILFADDEQIAILDHLERCLRAPDIVHRWEIRKLRKDGSHLWVRDTARVLVNDAGDATLLMVSEDVTEARTLSEQLSYQASHDVLTGLANRRAFEDRLHALLETAREDGAEHALCYLDLDRFKIINDTCGHTAGDELLRQLGSLLQTVVRRGDTLARLGGDEFAVLMGQCTLQQARRVAEAVRTAIQNYRFAWEGKSFGVGASIGLVPITNASQNITSILSAADTACYAAKDAGRNRIHVYEIGNAELARQYGEMQWIARINQALEEDRFRLEYQPISPIAGAGVEGDHYELLLRMVEESGVIIRPDDFLPAAERYRLSAKLDRWVIATAFRWLADHPLHLERLFLCSINLSGQSVTDEDFLEFVIRQFNETGVPPAKICFEITETSAIASLSSASHLIMTLQGIGCRFALDDFGSGLSSFAYLKNLPVDFIKIDGMFVKGIVDDPIDLAMVKSINEIGRVMGKKTVAEFVEREAILTRLQAIGVDYAQGYGIGRPKPLDTMD